MTDIMPKHESLEEAELWFTKVYLPTMKVTIANVEAMKKNIASAVSSIISAGEDDYYSSRADNEKLEEYNDELLARIKVLEEELASSKTKTTAKEPVSVAELSPSTLLTVGEFIFFKPPTTDNAVYKAQWDGIHFVIQDSIFKGADTLVKTPSTFATRILQMCRQNGTSSRTSTQTCGWRNCYVTRNGKDIRLIKLA